MARGFEEDGVQPSRPARLLRENREEINPLRTVKEEVRPAGSKEIHVRINPGRLARVGLVIVVVLAIFFLGRLSANNFQLTGLTTGDVSGTTAEKTEPEAEITVDSAAEKQPETQLVEEPAVEEDKSDESIVNVYKNSKISLESVEVQWMETWGKILALEYSITNGETGSIEPGHFLIMMEGYDDIEKKATLPPELQLIRSGETQAGKLALDKPFNYNELEAGNLEKVVVRAILFNNADPPKPIASSQKELNLKR